MSLVDKSMRRKELNHALWIVAQARVGSLPLVVGDPGMAKSEATMQFSKELSAKTDTEWEYRQFILSQQMPEDAGGMKYPGKIKLNGAKYDCVLPMHDEIMVRAMNTPTLVHLDEINQAQPAVMAANQELWFNNPPEQAMVLASCNSVADATDGYEFSSPVVNRMCILDWEWCQVSYNMEGIDGEFPPLDFPVLPADWSGHMNKWQALRTAFLTDCPHMAEWGEFKPKPGEDSDGKPYASPRSMKRGLMCLGAAESVGASRSVAMKILKGFVGESHAIEFFDWHDKLNYPPAHVLLDDNGLTHLPRQFDIAVAIVRGVHSLCKSRIQDAISDGDTHKAEENFEKGLKFSEKCFDLNREVGAAIAGDFTKLKPQGSDMPLLNHRLWDSIASSRSQFATAAR